jgi:hypothetical protein
MSYWDLMKLREGENKPRFNIIGFSNAEPIKHKHCIFCVGRRLNPDPHDDTKLLCFGCGYSVQ